jgi:hypothetical protein
MDEDMTPEERIEIACDIIRAELSLGRYYSVSSDEMLDRTSITAEHLRKICEFGLKVTSGVPMPGFDQHAQYRWDAKHKT